VLRLETGAAAPQWQAASVNCGLALRDRTRFEAVEAVAAGAGGALLAGSTRGVYRSTDGVGWAATANRQTRQLVTVPETWLLCSGEHDIEVVHDASPVD
jgi:hypothetical protein